MKQWLAGVAAASLLAAAAMAMTPKGRVRQVVRLACGALCALAIASPILELDVGAIAADMAAYEARARQVTADAEEEARSMDRTYIEDRCEAYIWGKAAAAGVSAGGVSVTARWDQDDLVWYPWTAALDAPFDRALSALIEGELGIPRARQSWRDDG